MNIEIDPDASYLTARPEHIEPARPAGNYLEVAEWNGLLFIAGHGPADTGMQNGLVGLDLTVREGYACARSAALNCLTSIRAHLGSLHRIERLLSLTVYVRAQPEFRQHPAVADGASDLFVEVFGRERGFATRDAVGVASLPFGLPVELKLIAAVTRTSVQ
jgi:enamine deaminase RidA (YjgF/YER057c/UK114 family)